MKTDKQLINNVIGQLNGVGKMMEEQKDCLEILVQLKAAKAALNNVVANFLECNLDRCLKSEEKNEVEYKKLVSELTKNS
ncbi:metal-sensitive transcriptional regulator [Patescibacteria group bacterium]